MTGHSQGPRRRQADLRVHNDEQTTAAVIGATTIVEALVEKFVAKSSALEKLFLLWKIGLNSDL